MEEEQWRAEIQNHKRREGKGRGRLQIQIPPHLPHQSCAVVSISRCMEVTRAGEKEQGGRELRRSLKAATVTLYSGGMEGVWVAAGREGEKEGGVARRWRDRTCGRMVRSGGSGGEMRENSGDEKDEWIRRRGETTK